MADENITLLIKHLPSDLKAEEQKDLIRHFGATTVKTMGNKGRMKHTAFATFASHDAAEKALRSMHQLDVLGRKLVVEFSNSQQRKNHPSQMDHYKEPTVIAKNEEKKPKPVVAPNEINMKRVAENVNSFASQWDVKYALDPRLEYMYPQPTVNILTNIANTLASVPKFYVQVLHLMNKLNLPAPFGAVTQTPVLPQGNPLTNIGKDPNSKSTSSTISDLKRNFEEGTSTEESEIESDEDQSKGMPGLQPKIPMKRKNKSVIKPNKRLKLVQNLPQTLKPKAVAAKPSDVFEQPDVTGPKKIAFNLSRFEEEAAGTSNGKSESAISTLVSAEQSEELEPAKIVEPAVSMVPLPGAPPLPPMEPANEPTDYPAVENTASTDLDAIPPLPPSTETEKEHAIPGSVSDEQTLVEVGGFGKFEPAAPAPETENGSSDDEWGETEFISSKELRKGRISSSEKREHSVFKNYQKGEPSTRLYVKNIAKPVTEKDMHYIFGRYVDWNNEVHKNMFDIRLMKEGRMKGQAFVTLPNIELAKSALSDTHGFMLQGKPIAVQFARSAKPKDDATKGNEKKSK